ncbi:GNAT family N-acetyltransferase [Clostridium beijerinckii]|jgi:Acetyltransferases|uniref:GNAT family N-acetyltransferase n=2 Tax=Clostridium beijerinckii TaxID=1520 RepID=A0AAW3WGZ7_CLOBE|nr:GNAT family N-acetyltransferase [Clostridium beijerinckii]MBC2460359.1 GNAT family N-acetyltransferase [Clostridium beijerinckii]MBC2477839.1 GNAT family N-acetyltransferase [Clostridium beijerinckii]MDG5856001.1 GNAT family N-acetyltransferase [Clostridium beijerinckii]NOV61102.1 putative acetyltransferase [Clostridium beijerinckii]NOV69405.1 putative acetyltransferase [Clostridium beijerinckii]
MNIRIYKTGDCEEIIKLFYETVHSINVRDYTKSQLDAWAPKKINIAKWNKSFSKDYTIVAEDIGSIVGFGNLDHTGYFDKLFVHKDYQGEGIATMIASELEKYSQENNIKVITVEASITAKPFFEKRGYHIVRQQEVERKGQLLTNFVMKKLL